MYKWEGTIMCAGIGVIIVLVAVTIFEGYRFMGACEQRGGVAVEILGGEHACIPEDALLGVEIE